MNRREFSRAIKGEMIRRATVNSRLFCEGCGLDVTGKEIEFDHTIAEALVIDKSKKLTAADGKVLGKSCCHRGENGKTNNDVKIIAKAVRNEFNRAGAKTPPRVKMRSQGFPKAAKPERSKPALPNRALYRSE